MLRSWVLLVVVLSACVRAAPPAPLYNPPAPAPAPPAGACELALANLQDLGCAAAEGSAGPDGQWGTEDDETFLERCEQLAADHLVDPGCWAEMTDCGGCS